ncbi:MAG: amino acid ABC transporter permease [Proteobacteria bacterium]|nr:amino acid ABC transporter permease [Pseudomonadota bacterium]
MRAAHIVGRGCPPAAPPLSLSWRDARVRAVFVQASVAAAVAAIAYFFVHNSLENLERLNVKTGFQFLARPAGFGITQHLIPYDEDSSYGRAFLVALLNTLLVSAISVVLATIIGFTVGLARLSRNWLVAKLATAYVETIRNVPLLLHLFFWYFAVLRPLPGPRQSVVFGGVAFLNNRGLYLPAPILEPGFAAIPIALLVAGLATGALVWWSRRTRLRTGRHHSVIWYAIVLLIGLPFVADVLAGFPIGWDIPRLAGFNFQGGVVVIHEFVALTVGLSIYSAAYVAEIVRAGVLAVPKGQVEAARSLGLRPGQVNRLVVVPQALRVIVPPLTSQYLNLTKNSSLAAAIAYPEIMLVFAGTVLNQTGQPFEVMTITMAVYLGLSLIISLVMNWYNRRITLKERTS